MSPLTTQIAERKRSGKELNKVRGKYKNSSSEATARKTRNSLTVVIRGLERNLTAMVAARVSGEHTDNGFAATFEVITMQNAICKNGAI